MRDKRSVRTGFGSTSRPEQEQSTRLKVPVRITKRDANEGLLTGFVSNGRPHQRRAFLSHAPFDKLERCAELRTATNGSTGDGLVVRG